MTTEQDAHDAAIERIKLFLAARTPGEWLVIDVRRFMDDIAFIASKELKEAAAQGRREALETKIAPLSIDCDGCRQVVTIPTTGDVGCGCPGTRWSLTRIKNAEESRMEEQAQ